MKLDIKQLTLEEKMKIVTGRDWWRLQTLDGKLPEVFLADGPHGLRMQNLSDMSTKIATAMPSLSVLANTWSVEMAYLEGETIGDDCVDKGADILLAPGVNMKRTPLCGRNFEYFSEDPYLAGMLAKSYIEGVQDKGIGTSLKHYVANNREYDRAHQSSEIDERTLREIYLPAFEIALEAKPWTVMCAYNPINGVYASENKWLLTDILRDEFGFDGIVISDWGATKNAVRAVKAGLDLTMPDRAESYEELKTAYEAGKLTEEDLDKCVERLLALMEKSENFKPNRKTEFTKEERHANAVKIAQEGIVLLKNEDNILPIKKGKLLLCGASHDKAMIGGGGSAEVITDFEQKSLTDEVKARLGDNIEVLPNTLGITDVWTMNGPATLRIAKNADCIVYCMSCWSRESWDKTHINMPQIQVDRLLQLAEQNENIVVVVHAGSALDMSAWIDKVKAVVFVGFAGEGAQEATADILTGIVSPSGKLSETFPLNLETTPLKGEHGNGFVERYTDDVFVGYRWYDSFKKDVLFPFGYGLSYAQFEYSDIDVVKKGETDYNVEFNIKNISDIDAKEVAQVYVKDYFAMVARPEKELKGFTKVELKAGESKHVSVPLNARSFAYYSIPLKRWHVENGEFEIMVAASSRDIRLQKTIEISLPDDTQVTEH